MRYFLEIAYNGTPYHGWQRQPNAITVQQVLEHALTTILRQDILTVGAGRTDTGVHAKQLMVHFDVMTSIEEGQLAYKLNALLPPEIVVRRIREVQADAHARFDATSRSYQYRVHRQKDPFISGGSYYVKRPLDITTMNEAASILLQYTNFKCFSKSKTDVKTYNCIITTAIWKQEQEPEQLVFEITANRFLRNMVRAIVGTLIEVGVGKLCVGQLHEIIKSEDRAEAGYSVPAQGLYLTKVTYPKKIYKE